MMRLFEFLRVLDLDTEISICHIGSDDDVLFCGNVNDVTFGMAIGMEVIRVVVGGDVEANGEPFAYVCILVKEVKE